jgi:purine-nucleoside phosphorylase
MNNETLTASVATLRQRWGTLQPRVAVLLGSGWGPFADQVQGPVDVPCGPARVPQLAIGGHRACCGPGIGNTPVGAGGPQTCL